jgi:GGDEF domain-containing protein
MVQMSREALSLTRRGTLFMRLAFGVCLVGTVVTSIALGPDNLELASVIALVFWLSYALLAIRVTRKQLGEARRQVEEQQDVSDTIDRETGLATASSFAEQVKREIARSLRYGDRTTLAVFDIRITGFEPDKSQAAPPSPAEFITNTLAKSVRETDFVARLDLTHYAVLMTESDEVGGQALISRVRTWLALEPFIRDSQGRGVYVRAWAGCVAWRPEYHDSNLFLRAAVDDMERTRPSENVTVLAGVKGQAASAPAAMKRGA